MAPPTTPSAIADAERALQQTYELLGQARKDCVTQFNRIVDRIDYVVAPVSDLVGGPLGPVAVFLLHHNVERLREALQKGLEIADKVLRGGTPVLSLFKVSIDYLETVQAPVSGMSGVVTRPQDDNLVYWTAKAADRYKDKQEGQRKAVDDAAANAAFLSGWLYKVGQCNVDYAVRIMQSLVEAAAKMVEVAVDAAGVVTLPFAVDSLAETINGLVTVCVQELIGLAGRFTAVVGDVRDLVAQGADNSPFPDGRWPEAVYHVG